jgi:uncharacterized protein YdaU (DUF1376 family)
MGKDKPQPLPWTRFSYDDFFKDHAVVCMTNEEVGAYLRLLSAAWSAPTPGHLPNDPAYLAHASGMLEAWPKHAASILRAFKVKGDTLIQKRVVEEYEAALVSRKASSAQAKHAAEVRYSKHAVSMQDVDVDLDLDVEVEESKSTPLSGEPDVVLAPLRSDPKKTSDKEDWADGFRQFWEAYPQRPNSSKKQALRVWMTFQPKDYSTADDQFSEMMESLAESKKEWVGRDPDKIPHHVVWLRRELWRNDAPPKA